MPTKKSVLGHKAECLAAGRLRQMGYRRIERNFRCRYGEIDIIGWDGDCLAFVEVRSHSTLDFGEPAESVGAKKRTRLNLTAQTYLSEKQIVDTDCRFDVVEVIFSGKLPPQIKVIKNAFEATEGW